jgi:hypothetical protein
VSGAAASEDGSKKQMQTIAGWTSGQDAAWERLGELTMCVFAANGAHDVMTDAQRLRDVEASTQCDGPNDVDLEEVAGMKDRAR